MTKRFVVTAVTQCTTLLDNNFGKEKLCLILSFLSIESTSQYKLKETLSSSSRLVVVVAVVLLLVLIAQ